MNTLNYCTREAAQRLVDAGIVLETDFVWSKTSVDTWELRPAKWKKLLHSIPAPSTAEVWRELSKFDIEDIESGIMEVTSYDLQTQNIFKLFLNIDESIDLLIWVRKEKK